jgi:Tol biopolymer transport system component
MLTGKSRLILSLHQIHGFLQDTSSVVKNGKIVINHITCNINGGRFVFLVRNFPEHGKRWGTAAITADADGSDLYILNGYSMTSHYNWRDEQHFLAYAKHAEGDQLYLLRDKSQAYEIIDRDFFKSDGHCSYAPGRTRILYDSYPVDSYRHLYVYDIHGHKGRKLASLYSVPVSVTDFRCDLHPRWHPNGKMISFDSTHENQRQIYIARPAPH